MVLRVFFFSELAQSSQNVSVYLLYSKFKICHLLSTFSDPLPVRAKVLETCQLTEEQDFHSVHSQPLGKALIFPIKKTKQHQTKIVRVPVQSCQTLWDCSLPGSSVRGISQARILEWVAISSSGGSRRPRDQMCVSCIGR